MSNTAFENSIDFDEGLNFTGAVYSIPDQQKFFDCPPKKDLQEIEDNSLNGSWPSVNVPDNISGNCFDFCNSQGLLGSLNKSLQQIKELFSNIQYLFAELEYYQDDEIEQSEHIAIHLKVSSNRVIQKAEYKRWIVWFVDNISNEHRLMIVLDIVRI